MTGNCGVGFAPVRPGQERWLIELMEGVEDIPGAALHEGMQWGWESFPEYLDVLSGRQWAVDVAVQLPHGPLRGYVMGDRGAKNEKANAEDIAEMSRLASEAMQAGAFGFTTSRTLGHTSLDGTPVPGTFAADDELFAIAQAVRDGGGRIFEVAMAGISPGDDPSVVATELDWIGTMAASTGLTATFIVLQHTQDPGRWRTRDGSGQPVASARRQRRARSSPAGRSACCSVGRSGTRSGFVRATKLSIICPGRSASRSCASPELRERILAEAPVTEDPAQIFTQAALTGLLPFCYVLAGDSPDYEQPAAQSLMAIAERAGTSVEAAAYDALTAGDGSTMLLLPLFNYADANHDALYEQMQDPSRYWDSPTAARTAASNT